MATGNHVRTYPNNRQPDIHPGGSPIVMNGTGGGKNNLIRYDNDGMSLISWTRSACAALSTARASP